MISGKAAFGHSGRKFVIALTVSILILWGLLFIGFRAWKNGYDRRAAQGRSTAALVRQLVRTHPPTVERWRWEDTVDHAEAMLIAVTGSDLLSESQLNGLTHQVKSLVADARKDPDRVPELLREFWDDVAKKAGPIADIYGRPEILGHPDAEAER